MLNDEDIINIRNYMCEQNCVLSDDVLEKLRNKLTLSVEYINFQSDTQKKQVEFQKKMEELNKKESV